MSEPTDSLVDWVKQHLARYVASDGADGQLWRGVPTLLLTVTGRSSGATRRTALIYAVDGDDVIVVASKGGADEHPQWYLNLQADPDVRVQVGPVAMPRRLAPPARTNETACGRWRRRCSRPTRSTGLLPRGRFPWSCSAPPDAFLRCVRRPGCGP